MFSVYVCSSPHVTQVPGTSMVLLQNMCFLNFHIMNEFLSGIFFLQFLEFNTHEEGCGIFVESSLLCLYLVRETWKISRNSFNVWITDLFAVLLFSQWMKISFEKVLSNILVLVVPHYNHTKVYKLYFIVQLCTEHICSLLNRIIIIIINVLMWKKFLVNFHENFHMSLNVAKIRVCLEKCLNLLSL